MKDKLEDVLNAILVSRYTSNRIFLNFGWAFIYNLILVPIAMGVLYPAGVVLDPMYAGLAMALSSVSVVVSSLLLKMFKPVKM
jgi:Cu+-exporting ATPase